MLGLPRSPLHDEPRSAPMSRGPAGRPGVRSPRGPGPGGGGQRLRGARASRDPERRAGVSRKAEAEPRRPSDPGPPHGHPEAEARAGRDVGPSGPGSRSRATAPPRGPRGLAPGPGEPGPPPRECPAELGRGVPAAGRRPSLGVSPRASKGSCVHPTLHTRVSAGSRMPSAALAARTGGPDRLPGRRRRACRGPHRPPALRGALGVPGRGDPRVSLLFSGRMFLWALVRDTKTNVKNPAGEHRNAPSEGHERAGEGAALAAPGGGGRGPGAPVRATPRLAARPSRCRGLGRRKAAAPGAPTPACLVRGNSGSRGVRPRASRRTPGTLARPPNAGACCPRTR